jgi:ubiquitin-protein ligase
MLLLPPEPRERRSQLLSFESKKVIPTASAPPFVRFLCGALTLTFLPDLSELALPSTMKTDFPDPDDTLNFKLIIEPDEGMYKGGRFFFTFAISQGFPHEAPKVKCTQKIYHPNIDLDGNVCLNILREDWKTVLNLQSVVVGLQVGLGLKSWEDGC